MPNVFDGTRHPAGFRCLAARARSAGSQFLGKMPWYCSSRAGRAQNRQRTHGEVSQPISFRQWWLTPRRLHAKIDRAYDSHALRMFLQRTLMQPPPLIPLVEHTTFNITQRGHCSSASSFILPVFFHVLARRRRLCKSHRKDVNAA